MRYRLAVLDIAGTTVADPGLVAGAFAEAMAAAGNAIEVEDVRPLMGYPKPQAIARLLETTVDDPRVAPIHTDFVARMLECYRHAPGIAPLPGAEAVFDTLRAHGIRIGLDTGFSRDIAEVIIERLGWHDRIDALVASDEVPAGRPAPYMIQALMQCTGVDDAATVVKVGDTEVDINEGRNAGVGLNVAITTGAFTRAELLPHGPDHIIDHLDRLPSLLGLARSGTVAAA
ncbi:HAD family hydrolase [Stenotrophomonas sp. CC120223-11]|uniref:HAD family hydrolase n=1 Tax=Stenotrophomonas sp. CC120223-11 TaxID=1378090 RepID=UPI000BD97905|nr:HAD family hydrolase [Stenotrophomonas sp. CC120223-11]SNY65869.1 phosphonatase-like hydrolase [Stenotrophomonas sp. CC120223-11]